MRDSLQMTVQRCLQRYRFFDTKGPLVVAVSTGVDSMVLLTILQKIMPTERIVVAHVNHHLRQQSQDEEQFIRQYCQRRGIRLFVDQWVDHPGHGIEEAARQERYRYFAEVLDTVGSQYLLTAHHENDLAETMLMKLVRTGDVRATIGIREARLFDTNVQLLRPLLSIPKQQLVKYAQNQGIRWFEDSTNQEDDTERNRFRHHYLPALEKENPQLLDHLLKFHRQLVSLVDQQETDVKEELNRCIEHQQLLLSKYLRLPNSMRPLVIQQWLAQQGLHGISDQQTYQIDHLLGNAEEPSGRMPVASAWVLVKNYDQARLEKVRESWNQGVHSQQFMVKFDHWNNSVAGEQFGVFHHPTNHVEATIWLDQQQLPLLVRNVQPGDALRLKSGHYQKVRRILINEKIPLDQRDRQQVLVDAKGEVLWLIGVKTAWLDRQRVNPAEVTIGYFCRKADTGEKDE